MTESERYAEKIGALLRKAESTTPEEAELLVAKAQELMTKYAIDQAMLDAAEGRQTDEIIQEEFVYVGMYRGALANLCWQVLNQNNCKGVQCTWRTATVNGKLYKQTHIYTVTGFRSDVERVRLLCTSLEVQAISAMWTWWKDYGKDWMTRHDGMRDRQGFIEAFGNAVGNRLAEANRRARAEAVKAQAERASETAEQAETSVALVLRSRQDQVKDWYDNHYGNSLRKSRVRYNRGSGSARSAGHRAGSSADLGQGRIRGQRELGQ